ncbi:MAG: hypothetical protein ACJ79S_10905 [Gemmatimonadaceae bacterium]
MADANGPAGPQGAAGEGRGARNVGVGCFMAIVGFFSGGMFGVLVVKAIDFFTKAPSCPDVPSCHWAEFFFGGALIGALSLPTLVLLRLRRGDAGADNSPRG